jgi:hypothetical protein
MLPAGANTIRLLEFLMAMRPSRGMKKGHQKAPG